MPRRRPSSSPAPVEPLERRRLLSTTYYVSASGKDANPGTSTALPLRTLAAVDKLALGAGDAVLLQGGAKFDGTLKLGADDGGTATAPVTISSYGTGRAEIYAGDGDGIDVLDTSGVAISDLNIEGDSPANDTSQGISLFNDRTAGGRLANGITIDSVDVGGFGLFGIGIGAATVSYGFDHVSVTHATLHDDDEAGLETYAGAYTANPAPYGLAHADLYVGDVTAYHNDGNTVHLDSGDGILLGDVADSVVEHCVAFGNGRNQDGGPAGIWTYNSDHVTIQYNESYDNEGGTTDGDGFDLDGGTTNAVLQYNYSHDNTGAGILLCQFRAATAWGGNVVRYNVSQDDGRLNDYAAITLWTPGGTAPLADSQVYANTVYVADTTGGSTPAGLKVDGSTDGVGIYNNLLDVAADLPTVRVTQAGPGLTFAGNDYWTGSAADANISWLGTTYDTLAGWRAAAGQEVLDGVAAGVAVAPGLANAGGGSSLSSADTLAADLAAYQLTAGSPLIDAGVSLTALGIAAGVTDFYGASAPQGNGFDIGAAEWVTTAAAGSTGDPTATPTTTPTATPITTPTATPMAAAVTVTASAAGPVGVGTAVTLVAAVSAVAAAAAEPTGTVTFSLSDGTALGTAPVSTDGTASLTTAALPVGVNAVSAAYGGDATYAAATPATAAAVTVNPAALSPVVARTTVPASIVAAAPHARGRVTVTVTNAGAATESGKATVELFLAPAGVLDATAVPAATATRRLSVKAGRSATLTVAVTGLPADLPTGTYRWLARVTDAAGLASISPAGPLMTVAAATVTLSATARASSLPATVAAGGRIGRPVTVSVTNAGNTPTAGPLSVTVYLSPDGSLADAVAVTSAKRSATARPAGPAVTLTVPLGTVPAAVSAGTYTLLALVSDAAGDTAMTALSVPLAVTAG